MDEVREPTPKHKSGWLIRAIRTFARIGLWILLLAWLLSYFGQRFYLAELLANFRVQFLVLFGVGLMVTVLARARWLLATCLALAFAWSCIEVGQIFFRADQPSPGETKIRVMSYNVLATNLDFDSAIQEIRKHDPDVIAIIEYANMWHYALDRLNDTYPHQHRDPRWHGYGIAVFSKLPFESAESIPLTRKEIDNPAASISLKVDGQLLRLIAVHVMSPTTLYRLELRNRQFEEIAELVAEKPTPTILVGDMNCSPSSNYLRKLIKTGGLRDSRQGFGIHNTWVAPTPLLSVPIDHAFVSDTIHVHDRFVGECSGSDHHPIIVDFSLGTK